MQQAQVKQTKEEVYAQRFGGIKRLYGEAGLMKIQAAKVLVIGIGGVGSWVAESLARTGVGAIDLMDLDDICITNINRQIHALTNSVGNMKTYEMKQRILQINPYCEVNEIEDFLDQANISEYIKTSLDDKYDFVVDAIDNLSVKTALLAYCKRYKVKVISVGAAGGKKDPSKIQIADLSEAYQDPLLAKVRQQLRKIHHFPSADDKKSKFKIPVVFSSEAITMPKVEGGCGVANMNCNNGFGALCMVTASFGLLASSYVIEKIVKF